MLNADFTPKNEYMVIRRLAKISVKDADRTIQAFLSMVLNPRIDPWAFYEKEQVRVILAAALAARSSDTVKRAREAISVFSSRGETSYLDLLSVEK